MATPTPYANTLTETSSAGLGEYLNILRKRRRLALLVGVPILALGLLAALLLPSVYRASGQIEIEGAQRPRTNTSNALVQDVDDSQYADQYVRSLSTAVLGDATLGRLLDEHQLYDDQNDDRAGAIKRLRSDVKVDIVTVPILDPNTGREREVVNAFTVNYENRDPQRAQQGAAWLVNAFLDQNRNDRQSQAQGTAEFFAGEAERMREHVAGLEQRLAQFKQQHAGQLPELNQVNLSVMDRTEGDLLGVQTQLQALRRDRVFLQSQLQQARASGTETVSLRALEDEYARKSAQYDQSHPDLLALKRQIDRVRAGGSNAGLSLQAQLQTERSILAETRQRYSADHPDVRRIQRNIEALEARIAAGESPTRSLAGDSPMAVQLQTQVNAADTQIAALEARAEELRGKLGTLEGRLTAAPEVEREYQAVTRDLAGARAKYDELLKRQMDAELSQAAIAGGAAEKFRVKALPTTPDAPAKPARLAIFVIALVLGSILAVSAVILAQLLDPTVRGARDIRDLLDVSPLTSVPVIGETQHARRGPAYAGMACALAVSLAITAQFIG